MKRGFRKMKRIKYDDLGRVIKNAANYKGKKFIKPTNNSNKIMKKDDAILKLENDLYNPQPNVTHIVLDKIYSGIYQYKDYIIQKVDKTIKYRPFNYDWKIYKNEKYIITVSTLEKAKLYFNSIKN